MNPVLDPDDSPALSGDVSVIAAIAAKIQSQGPTFAQQAHAILGPVANAKTRLRDHLTDHPHHPLHRLPEQLPEPTTLTVVDGASVKEQMYAAELIAVVATNADGLSNPIHYPPSVLTEITVQPYRTGNTRLKDGLMFLFELMLASSLPHEVRFMDGATNTAIMAIAKVLQGNDDAAELFAKYARDYMLTEALTNFATPTHGTIAALPKSDSSDVYLTRYSRELNLDDLFRGSDRVFAQQVLEPGEMLDPYPVRERRNIRDDNSTFVTFAPRRGMPRDLAHLMGELEEAAEPYMTAVEDGEVYTTYFKPAGSDTALKIEYRGDLNEAFRLAGLLTREIVPTMIEPYPQYKVDQSAKKISGMTSLMKQQIVTNLPGESADYAKWLLQRYRT